MNCPNCRAPYAPGANFCFQCGQILFQQSSVPQNATAESQSNKALLFLTIFVGLKVFENLWYIFCSKLLYTWFEGKARNIYRTSDLVFGVASTTLVVLAAIAIQHKTYRTLVLIFGMSFVLASLFAVFFMY